MYAASVDNRGLEQTIEVLGDVVLRPQFSLEEMEFCEMDRSQQGHNKLIWR